MLLMKVLIGGFAAKARLDAHHGWSWDHLKNSLVPSSGRRLVNFGGWFVMVNSIVSGYDVSRKTGC